MDIRLQQAARFGNFSAMKDTALDNPAVLLAKTLEERNTCLHIACKEGREEFCEQVVAMNGSLLTAVNRDGETPLLVAVKEGHVSLARYLLRWCRYLRLSAAVLKKQDKDGCNALHHAIVVAARPSASVPNCTTGPLLTCGPPACRRCHGKLALELIEAEPALSQAVNNEDESPMFLAVKSRYCAVDVLEKLMKTRGASNKGGHGHNALQPTASVVVVVGREAGTTTSIPPEMDRDLMKAATTGKVKPLISAGAVTEVLCGTNAMGNNCLHIAAMRGHKRFCRAVLCGVRDDGDSRRRLLGGVNTDGETPLLVAVASGHIRLASFLLSKYDDDPAATAGSDAILKQDKHECNVLHHAIRSGHRKFAVKLIAKAPGLSRAVNRHGESPMFIAAMRNYNTVFNKILLDGTDDPAYFGAAGYNALHAAVRNGNNVIAMRIMQTPLGRHLAREENMLKQTPVELAVRLDQAHVLRVLLRHDPSLGYVRSSDGIPLLNTAARCGHVRAARALLRHCPDAPYASTRLSGWTCLHEAVKSDQLEFVKFVLNSPQLRKLVNMRDKDGRTAVHHTALDCKPQMLEALLARPRHTDVTVLTNKGHHASWTLDDAIKSAKSLRWNEVSKLLQKADPNGARHIDVLHKEIHSKITDKSRKNVKALTESYIRNTSVVAVLMASITFAAAFAFSGWYKGTDDTTTAKKFTFGAFFISDSLAMCLSLSVAFLSVIARWEDLEFLLFYRTVTKKIMWVAYVATLAAFAAGLCTFLAPRLLWLGIGIWFLPALVLLLTCLFDTTWLVRWWVAGKSSETDLLDMVCLRVLCNPDLVHVLRTTVNPGKKDGPQVQNWKTPPVDVVKINVDAAYLSKKNQGATGVVIRDDKGKINLAALRNDNLHVTSKERNVLHHAIRSGHRKFAVKLIAKAPTLSRAVNRHGESPMFIAAMRNNYNKVFNKILEYNTDDDPAAYVGAGGYNALHAAVRNGNKGKKKNLIMDYHTITTS
ncbi:hypothetical protein U9M48_016413 [Paspalum notatum var. saurae]|uniref:PGG domain-containing protein n=1 Tax=Paspalum notatum var. saurae TaxID=547442 RepID=A0AAQ3WMJ6_PASNO